MNALPGRRWFLPVFAGLVALHIALVWTTRIFPFTDLPNHLAAAAITRSYDDPSTLFSRYFALDIFPRPNVFHLLFCSRGIFPSVEFANRLFLSMYIALLPLSALLFLARTGGNRWHAIASFVLLYNYSVSWGFVGFFFAIPLVLIFAAMLAGYLERGGFGRAAFLMLLLAALFFVHALAALFALVLLVACALARTEGGTLTLLSRLAPAVPLVLLLVAWWRSGAGGEGLAGFLGQYYAGAYFPGLASRIHLLFLDNYHLFEGRPGALVATALTAAIIVPGMIGLIRAHGKSDRDKLFQSVPFLLFACSLACFVLLPNEIPRQSILYQRFSALLLLSFVLLAASVTPAGGNKPRNVLFVTAAVVHLVLWAGYFDGFERENRGFDAGFFPAGSSRMSLAGLVFENSYRGKPVYIHFPSYFMVWQKGIATTRIVDYRFGPVRRRPHGPPLPQYQEWIAKTDGSGGLYADMDLVLVRGAPPERAGHHFWGRLPIREVPPWLLYGPRGS